MRRATVMLTVAGVLVAVGGCTTGEEAATSTTAPSSTSSSTMPVSTTVTTTPTVPPTTVPPTTVPPTSALPTTPTAAPTVPPTSAAPTTVPVAELPSCADVELTVGDDGQQRYVDCTVVAPDDSVPSFVARYGDGPSFEEDGTLTLVAADDSQTITERYNLVFDTPYYDDLDGNGTLELVIPQFVGASNTAYVIWFSPSADAPFVRGVETAALAFGRSANGEAVAIGHVSAAESFYSYYRIAGDTMTAVADALVNVADGTCTVSDTGGLGGLGLTDDEAHDRFCSDPVVTG